jgi:hypothetical protein
MIDARQVERVLSQTSRARRKLSLADVVSVGVPAVYQQFGEQLLYVDGTIFDASDPSLPSEILNVTDETDEAVGLEFGWQHAGDCSCHLCASERTARNSQTTGGRAAAK